jgi:hypothetical protein
MVPPLLVPIGATIGATLFGAGALGKIGERAGLDEAGDAVFDQFPDAIQQDPATPQAPANGEGATSDTGGIGGILLALGAFIAFLVFGNTILEELL